MADQQLEAEAPSKKDNRQFEEALQKLWEKTRLVSDMLVRLKEENKSLKARAAELESGEQR